MFLTRVSKMNGNTTWYINVTEPPHLAQAVGSPVPPPRQRQNPFNKPDNNSHQRSHSMRSAPGTVCFIFLIHLR